MRSSRWMYIAVHQCTMLHVSTTMTVSEARAALPQILDRVLAGEEVTLTRHGQPVAVVVRPDMLRARRAGDAFAVAERVRDLLEQSGRTRLRDRPTLSEERAEALVADVRAARSTGLAVTGLDAFDADVLIYAAVAEHELGRRVRALFPTEPIEDTGVVAGIGSVLLLPELLTKPLREHAVDELAELGALLCPTRPASHGRGDSGTRHGTRCVVRTSRRRCSSLRDGGGRRRRPVPHQQQDRLPEVDRRDRGRVPG